MAELLRACVVGYGVAGRLHRRLLETAGFQVCVADPSIAAIALLGGGAESGHEECWFSPARVPGDIAVWSICTPTAVHVDTLEEVLRRDPAACVILEKPACRAADEIRLVCLLARYPRARVAVVNQYSHSQAVHLLDMLRGIHAPHHPVSAVRVAFSKDRRPDIGNGRFVDRDHGVFGYEWPYMLAAAGQLLPQGPFGRYLNSPVEEVRGTVHPGYFVTAAAETARVADGVSLELFSSVVGHRTGELEPPSWTRAFRRAGCTRQRLVQLEAGPVRFTAELAPVTLAAVDMPANVHRVTADLPSGRREWLVHDSPLDNALRAAVGELLSGRPMPPLDLRPVRRIGALSARFRARRGSTPPDGQVGTVA